jgi:beta-lactam-binding protein with PASTA domain
VPELKGKALPAAKRSIESHGCSVGAIKRVTSRRFGRNHVISQKPRPGRRLGHGAKVSLVVSEGP